MKAVDIMTANPLTATKGETLWVAAERMSAHHYGGLPVVDEAGAYLGVLEMDDLLPKPENIPGAPDVIALQLFDKWVDEHSIHDFVQIYKEKRVEEVMRTEVPVLKPGDPLRVVLDKLIENLYRRMPVVDEEGRLVGIITRGDLLMLLMGRK
ncbi:CBS domain-containing protein [Oceanithermus desulfurans]